MTPLLRSTLLFIPLGIVATGCADLPAVTDNRCGNGVLETEAGEDCDGGERCGLPGTAEACRSLCTTDADCGGGDCGVDGICRAPSGDFELVQVLSVSGTRDVMLGDLDGDGCGEMVRTEARGSEVIAFESREPGFCLPAERDFTPGIVPEGMVPLYPVPTRTNLTSRNGGEVAFVGEGLAGQGIYVVEASTEAQLTSTIFGSQPLTLADGRAVRFSLGGRDVTVIVGRNPMGVGRAALVEDPRQPPLEADVMGNFGESVPVVIAAVEPLTDEPPMGPNPLENCGRIVYALPGASALSVIEVCPGTPPMGMMQQGTPPSIDVAEPIAFPNGVVLNDTPALYVVDLDEDGQVDDIVVSGAPNGVIESAIFVTYGLDDGSFNANALDPMSPMGAGRLERDLALFPEGLPPHTFFAVGEFVEDTNDALELVELPCPPSDRSMGSPSCKSVARRCEAVVADLNGDGADDIVANEGAQAGLAIRLGGKDADLPVTYLDTTCPPRALTVADLDGDRINDVAFLDQTTPDGEPLDALSVAHGKPLAVPEAPVVQGAYGGAVTLSGGRFEPDASTDQIASLRALPMSVPASPEQTEPTNSHFALIEGGTQRLALAPYLFPATQSGMPGSSEDSIGEVNILATVGGRFGLRPSDDGDEVTTGIAVITRGAGMTGDLTLWLLESVFDGSDLGPFPSQEQLSCDDCRLVAIDLEEGASEEGLDELVLLSASGASIYEANGESFSLRSEVSGAPAFSSLFTPSMGPESYASRPIVEDVDGDDRLDIVAVDGEGNVVLFLNDGQGGLTAQRWLDAPACTDPGGCKPPPIALLELDGTPGPELAMLANPEGLTFEVGMRPQIPVTQWLRLFDVDEAGQLVPLEAAFDLKGSGEVPDNFNSDLFSLAAGDVDGDGVDDLALTISSSVIYVLRGEPVNE